MQRSNQLAAGPSPLIDGGRNVRRQVPLPLRQTSFRDGCGATTDGTAIQNSFRQRRDSIPPCQQPVFVSRRGAADSTAAAPHRRHTSVFWANSPPGTPSGAAGGRAPHLLPWFLSWRGSRCPWNAWGCWRGSEPSRWGISRTSWACPGMACRRRQSPKSPRRLSWSSPRA